MDLFAAWYRQASGGVLPQKAGHHGEDTRKKVQEEFQKGCYAVFVAEPGTAMDGVVLGVSQKLNKNIIILFYSSKSYQPHSKYFFSLSTLPI